MTRQAPSEPHERNKVRAADLRPFLPAWLAEGSRGVADHLRAFAAKYPDRFEYRDGKLQTKRKA